MAMHTIASPMCAYPIEAPPSARRRALILVVEDEPDLAEILCHNLRANDFECLWVQRGRDALERVSEARPDLVILDMMLPDLPGEAVLAQLRRKEGEPARPIIIVTARGTEADQLIGLSLGADDYIVKPFSVRVLLARIRAILRRTRPETHREPTLVLGPLHFTLDREQVTVDGVNVRLTHTEFHLLSEIACGRGRVVRRSQLMDTVFGGADPFDRRLDVHITNLRRKLGEAARWVVTVRGLGFAIQDPTKTHENPPHGVMQTPRL